ncbi:GlxA family transcriptional regulator [Undibacterium sp. TJN19]|uniref:GlxA family transcriptional regulator n=1 Tax=Undibacterium sp. TJN19 TaxID=3413055 RepID=UPI003BF385A0
MQDHSNYDYTVLIMPGAYASSVSLTLDILAAAARMAKNLHIAIPRWRIYSSVKTPTLLSSGLSISAKALPRQWRPDTSTWIIPGLGLDNPKSIPQRLAQPDALLAIRALRAHARHGGSIAASCSAVFLLQAADLLATHKVTTSWWLAGLLSQLEPRCIVDANRLVIADKTIITAGAALAQTDMMLHLLRHQSGTTLADAVSRVLLIDGRQAQSPFIIPALMSNGNELIGALTTRIESSLPAPPSVADLAAEFCMSERTLARHVRTSTGRSTLDLVQSVRFGRARQLLETSRLTIEQIAERVGYNDSTAFRRMMKKFSGATPSTFRPAAYE